MSFKKILVPVDFSKCSGAALDYALPFGETFGATMEVLHAYEIPAYIPPHAMIVTGELEASMSEHAERDARENLARFLSQHQAADRVQSSVLLGPAALTILERLEKGDIDLVVMGTHGRSGLSRWVMGSTAEKVLRGTPCPVLTIRTPER